MAKVLLIGSGGREHALGWKLAHSDHVTEILFAPGNGGTEGLLGKGRNVAINADKPENFGAVRELIEAERVDLTVVGPEAPLSHGLVDVLGAAGINAVFGPSKACARLEGDKFFSQEMMARLNIPQAQSRLCESQDEAAAAIDELTQDGQVVLKARGLAAGKGVIVCDDAASAHAGLATLCETYGPQIQVCERLYGPEFSVFALCNGTSALPLPLAFQDHKPLLDGDKGPNTGGMGAYGPAPIAPTSEIERICAQVIEPILQEFVEQGTPYRGFLYVGMMLTKDGPKVLEFNVRFGDPECQPAMMMLDEDLYELLQQCVSGQVPSHSLALKPGAACCVVLASQGYPGAVTKGLAVSGVDAACAREGVEVFHAGTRSEGDELLTNGGRVFGVTAYSADGLANAQTQAYAAVGDIHVEGGFHFRTDIAHKALQPKNNA